MNQSQREVAKLEHSALLVSKMTFQMTPQKQYEMTAYHHAAQNYLQLVSMSKQTK
jgi:hypothetical protein